MQGFGLLIRVVIMLFAAAVPTSSFAVDESKDVTKVIDYGHWEVIQFAAPKQIVYRIASHAINSEKENLAFDFVPSEKCNPMPAELISYIGEYESALNHGVGLLEYQVPGQSKAIELTKTSMQPGDTYAFFQFRRLTARDLLEAHDRGHVAMWIPGSGDGTVKRSGNLYFSLNGFTAAYVNAEKQCNNDQ